MKKFLIIIILFSVCFANVNKLYSQKWGNDSKATLDATFLPSNNNIIAGDCINFTDYTSGAPTYWKWTFEGAEPSISYSQNPINICYYTPGSYTVILEVQNSTSVDTEVAYGIIVVSENTTTPVAYFSASQTTIPVGSTVTFTNLSQNGPFTETVWSMQGGLPNYATTFEPPTAIFYNTVGDFSVSLSVKDGSGTTSAIQRTQYIHVVPAATNKPIADFEADRTFIAPGNFVNFTDLSKNSPFRWEWIFQGGVPSNSYEQNPSGIRYQNAGSYCVTLIVHNNVGTDTLKKCVYIRVATTDPCLSNPNIPAPIADFEGNPRMINAGQKVYFKDRSINYPTIWSWDFEGGSPNTSVASNITRGIQYNTSSNSHFYDVYLAVNDACGHSSYMLKEKYIMVFSGVPIEYCDTISNINRKSETLSCPGVTGASWGYLTGNNSTKTIGYAEKFTQYQFEDVRELVMSVAKCKKITNDSYVTFYIWDGNTDVPEIVLGEKKVFLKDLPENYWNSVVFDSPIEVHGPFYAGYKLNYSKGANTAENNTQFAISVVSRGANEGLNTFFIQNQDSTWLSAYNKYGKAYSSSLAPKSCIIEVDDFDIQNNIEIYPNPATNNIFIQTGELEFGKDLFIQFFDVTGKCLFEKKTTVSGQEIMLDVTNYPSGLYFVSLITGSNKVSQKILINK
ncbi:MAG: PKD domain-containing protein [Bacteroidales bacterium]|jgi:PKD repeat protein|nr:PKD domain-containing protein [Bacteroidales bacterium]